MTVLSLPVDKKSLYRFDHLPASWFPKMLAAAAGLHALVLVLWMVLPHDGVMVVPVRTLNLRLGSHEGVIDEAPGGGSSSAPLTREQASNLIAETMQAPVRPYVPVAPPAPKEANLSQAQQDVLKTLEEKISEREAKDAEREKRETSKQDAMSVSGDAAQTGGQAGQAGSGRTPVKYVRGNPGGSVYGDSTAAEAAILSRYEQLISRWIEQYKRYPDEAKKQGLVGRGVVRIRINREGKVLFYALDKSTGSMILDRALNDMVHAADPVPKAPDNYPAGRLLEFLIPVEFNVK